MVGVVESYLTSADLAARLRIGVKSVYRMKSRGDLPEPDGPGRTPLWKESTIAAWEATRPGHGWRKGKSGPHPKRRDPS